MKNMKEKDSQGRTHGDGGAEVVADGAREDHWLLRYHPQLAAQGTFVEASQLLAVDCDGAGRELSKAEEQVDKRRFSTATASDDPRVAAARYADTEMVDGRLAGDLVLVLEDHVVEGDRARARPGFGERFALEGVLLVRIVHEGAHIEVGGHVIDVRRDCLDHVPYAGARKVSGWPRKCELAHAF
jgi:hypothetical protein